MIFSEVECVQRKRQIKIICIFEAIAVASQRPTSM
jgi:hypothetical protein